MTDGYIQVGTTAMRDPVTGEFLPSVPLFIREEDRKACEPPVLIDGDALQRELAKKFAQYKREEKKRKSRKGNDDGGETQDSSLPGMRQGDRIH